MFYCGLHCMNSQGADPDQLPSAGTLQQMAAYTLDPANLIPATARILLGGLGETDTASADATLAGPTAAAVCGNSPAVIGLPQHEELEFSVLGKLCYACR